jgi:anti-sigma factor RsiW
MAHPEELEIEAYFDGEVDAVRSAAIEKHLGDCAECAAIPGELGALRSAVQTAAPYFRAPSDLRARLMPKPSDVRPARSSRLFWAGAGSGFAAAAFGALAYFAVLPASTPLIGDLINAHLRSMVSDHLIDVASSDRHTVKPWLSAHTDIVPEIADFASDGYSLVGGRADYVEGMRVAVAVYRHGAHTINVFVWANAGSRTRPPSSAERKGYHIVSWQSGSLDYSAVSDAAPAEIEALAELLKKAAAKE